MDTYILVHGAWHTGDLLKDVADHIRSDGHIVYTPTLYGNNVGDDKSIGLDEAIQSLISFIKINNIKNCILVGHSYGGMIITGAFDKLGTDYINRLVYWNAFVPNPGESLNDMVPSNYVGLFDTIAQEDGSVLLPFPIWREAFINDADAELAKSTYEKLNPHPYKTFTDPIQLTQPPAAMEVGKSYLVCQEDIAMPASLPWHPRLSEKLGLYRLISMTGSHESCFTNPTLLGKKIIEAGRE
jgi:pimeloyl-ACP methyl ester carboxylesterase